MSRSGRQCAVSRDDDGRLIVREYSFGFLQGFSNLYCLDSALRLIWFAELPSETDLYVGAVAEEAGRWAALRRRALRVASIRHREDSCHRLARRPVAAVEARSSG